MRLSKGHHNVIMTSYVKWPLCLQEMGLLEEIILDHAVDFNHDSDLHSIEPSLTQMSSTVSWRCLSGKGHLWLHVGLLAACNKRSFQMPKWKGMQFNRSILFTMTELWPSKPQMGKTSIIHSHKLC